ncbi:MAG: response regulator transcription factor [Bacteroidetes bacterium]|nr:response regulator transcription factor [Bacteroidota bacterium]
MLRAIIIDDELIGINTLKVLIEKHTQGIKIVATATEPEKGITAIDDYKPEVVFLDISMPKMSGFELLEKVNHKNFKLVFTTAHQEYAIKAIKNGVYDYLLKPIDIEELKICINKILEESPLKEIQKKHTTGLIELSVKDGIIFIKPQDVIRLEASGSYTVFYLINNVKHIASKNLKEFEPMLDPNLFYRCHQSHIINLQKVEKMVSADGLFARMSDDSMPEIGKKNKEFFLEKLKNI